jgi:hypothetical protein
MSLISIYCFRAFSVDTVTAVTHARRDAPRDRLLTGPIARRRYNRYFTSNL